MDVHIRKVEVVSSTNHNQYDKDPKIAYVTVASVEVNDGDTKVHGYVIGTPTLIEGDTMNQITSYALRAIADGRLRLSVGSIDRVLNAARINAQRFADSFRNYHKEFAEETD